MTKRKLLIVVNELLDAISSWENNERTSAEILEANVSVLTHEEQMELLDEITNNEKFYYDVRVFDVLTADDDQEIIWDERYDDYEKALNQYHREFDRLEEGRGVELVRYHLDENEEQYDWEGLKGHFIYKEGGNTNG